MMRALTPFLVDSFIVVSPASGKEISKNGKAEDITPRCIKIIKILKFFKGTIDSEVERFNHVSSDFLNAPPFLRSHSKI